MSILLMPHVRCSGFNLTMIVNTTVIVAHPKSFQQNDGINDLAFDMYAYIVPMVGEGYPISYLLLAKLSKKEDERRKAAIKK